MASCTGTPNSQPGSEGGVRSDVAHVPWRTLLCYGPPIFALAAPLFFIQFFFLKFATDVLLLAPATVGVIFALGRAWDAVSDPIAGTLSDRTRSVLGRRRPWMLAAIPILGLGFAMTWIPPIAIDGTTLYAWVALALVIFYS